METTTLTLGETLAVRRRRLGLTSREIAVRVGVSQKTVSFWETGKSVPGVVELCRLARLIGVPFVELAATIPGVDITPEEDAAHTGCYAHTFDDLAWGAPVLTVPIAWSNLLAA